MQFVYSVETDMDIIRPFKEKISLDQGSLHSKPAKRDWLLAVKL